MQESSHICPPGFYCPALSGVPTACPAGTFNVYPGQTSISSCEICNEGYFCPLQTANKGTLCSPGYYCPAGRGLPLACPAGTFGGAARRGLIAVTQCLNCTAGHYCPGTGYPDPVPCPAGQYGPTEGASQCYPCTAGYACPNAGMTMLRVRCAHGYYCPTGTSSPFTYPCPQGSFTNRTDASSASMCYPCPARFACTSGTGGTVMPIDCPVRML
jgi:hypothetical protein